MQASKTLAWLVAGLVATVVLIYLWLPSWWLAIAVGVALYFVLTVIVGVYELKKIALNSVPENVRMVATHASSFPELETARLEQWTSELHALGFETLREYSVTSSNGKEVPCFARLFIHPVECCLAEIGQVFPREMDVQPIACVVYTNFESEPFDSRRTVALKARLAAASPPIPATQTEESVADFDDEWVLATTSRKLDPVLWALRHPRKLISTHVQESPSGLFEIHRTQREEMVKTLGVKVACDLSFEMFELRVASSNARLVRALRKKNPFLFLYEWRMVGPNRHEWWGDYPKARLRQK